MKTNERQITTMDTNMYREEVTCTKCKWESTVDLK
jgi:hypothetical protein